jgi:segregation and condensation protein B
MTEIERAEVERAELEASEAAPGEVEPDGPEQGGPEQLAPIELTEAALEALLFVAERPLSRREIASLAGTDRATVDARLGDLEVSLRSRGIRILADGDRVELATAPEGGALVARYVGADAGGGCRPPRSKTLAIVAYRRPSRRSAIESIRGVDSDYTIRTLLHRAWLVGARTVPWPRAGRPCTAPASLLERFGLTQPRRSCRRSTLTSASASRRRVAEPADRVALRTTRPGGLPATARLRRHRPGDEPG